MRLQLPSSGLLALGFGLHAFAGHGHDTTTSSTASTEVCESKTINYITHTLPQQCLRTNWSSANSTDQNTTTTAAAADTAPQTTVVEKRTETGHAAAVETGTGGTQAEASSSHDGTVGKGEDASAEDKEATAKPGDDDDEDLATSSFMSFEEWKTMMLKKAGQDPAELKERKRREGLERAELGPHDVLDSWGDDGEIALDFDVLSGRISDMTATASAKSGGASGDASTAEDKVPAPPLDDDGVARYRRPKDAGKTCKERFSYSSFDGGATILKTSPGAQNPKSILVENKDAYMLFTCSQENKFVIVELSEDVLVDTVVLANFEFFSSTIRQFRVSVSDKYPVKLEKWKDIGTYQARNSRDIQSFLIENPKIWAKYIRIEFLSHYGKEYYCPVSLLRVHGTRMLDTWKDVENAVPDDDETYESVYDPETVPEPELPQEMATLAKPETTYIAASPDLVAPNDSTTGYGISPWYPPLYEEPQFETCALVTPTTTGTATVPARAANDSHHSIKSVSRPKGDEARVTVDNMVVSSTAVVLPPTSTSLSSSDSTTNTSTISASEVPVSSSNMHGNYSRAAEQATKSAIIPPKSPPVSKYDDLPTKPTSKHPPTTHQHKNTTGTTSSAAASPTIQESFFKSITKRISYLEGNMTLSLQYIEEQSKFLQDSLQKMERRQISRIDNFLNKLNNTVFDELRSVKAQYDQHWQSTVLELESQREHFDRQILTLTLRVNLLADEVSFLKLMMIVLVILQVCCLIVVLFPRGPPGGEQWATTGQFFNTYLGSPRLPPGSPQSMRNRNFTPTHRWRSGRHANMGTLRPGTAQRSVSGGSYTDKVLPLTPMSETFDRSDNENGSPTPTFSRVARSPPQIRIDESEDFFDDDGDDKRRRPLIEELPTPEEESSGSATPSPSNRHDTTPGEDGRVYGDDDGEPNKPPLTRSPFSELGVNSRKPLPALPEDPVS